MTKPGNGMGEASTVSLDRDPADDRGRTGDPGGADHDTIVGTSSRTGGRHTAIHPREIGSYRITGVIDKGGMGQVYTGKHKLIGRSAAIKVLLPQHTENSELVQRFINEARAASKIGHPGIVEVYDSDELESGGAFIAMEHMKGENLAQRIRRLGQLDPTQAVVFCIQICSALQAVHDEDIVHRDLKPSNLFIVPDTGVPGGERIKLLDFGIAKLSEPGQAVATRVGAMMGTPQYMSPEQCNDSAGVDHRADIYSLGCILFQMLCGKPPFNGKHYLDVVSAQVNDEAPLPSSRRADIPPAIDTIVARALAKDPDHRFHSASAFSEALKSALGNGFQTMDMAEVVADERSHLAERSRWHWIMATAVSVGVVIAAGFVMRGGLFHSDPVVSPDPTDVIRPPVEPPSPILEWFQLAPDQDEIVQRCETVWHIRTSPPGAEVRHKGRVVGNTITPLLGCVSEQPARQETLEFALAGYWNKSVVLSSQQNHREVTTLSPVVTIRIESSPHGAAVRYAKGRYIGNTPLEITYEQNGHRTIVVSHEGYGEVKREIHFTHPHVERLKLARERVVDIVIESEPPGAAVWYNDTRVGETPYRETLPRQKGRRVFVLVHPGCESKRIKLRAYRDDSKRVTLKC